MATTTPADDSHTLARMLGKDLLNIVAQRERVPIVFRSKSVSRLSPTGTTGRVGSRPTSGPVDVDYVWHPFTSPNHSQPDGLVRLKDSLSRGPSFKPILTPRSTTPREPMLGSYSRERRRAAEDPPKDDWLCPRRICGQDLNCKPSRREKVPEFSTQQARLWGEVHKHPPTPGGVSAASSSPVTSSNVPHGRTRGERARRPFLLPAARLSARARPVGASPGKRHGASFRQPFQDGRR